MKDKDQDKKGSPGRLRKLNPFAGAYPWARA